MEPHPKRIKPTRIDDTNGKHPTAIERNTDLYNKLLDSYEEILKKTLKSGIRERLFSKARSSFNSCSKSFRQSSELRRLIENPNSLTPFPHLEILFKKFKANKKAPAAQCSTSKMDNEASVENDCFSSESYNTDLFEKFLDIVKERKGLGNYAETEKLMIKAWALFNNCKSSYKKSPALEDLLRKSTNLSTVDPNIQLKTVLDELKFNKKVVSDPVETKVNDSCSSSSTVQETASESKEEKPEENDSDDSLSGLDPQVRKKVKILEKTLRALNLRIKHLEERELDFTKDDDEDSAYVKLDRYYRRFDQVYAKICELKKLKADAGRVVKRKVSFPGGEIEKAIEKHYNKTNIFPDFQDILKITKEVKKKERHPPNTLHSIAQRVFEEFGRMLQRRRQMDVYESACAYLTNNDPAEEDIELKSKLEENYKIFKESEKKVIDLYAEKSHGIEAEEVDSNISNNEDDDEEEEEEKKEDDCSKSDTDNSSDHLPSPNLLDDDDDDNDSTLVGNEERVEKPGNDTVQSSSGNSSNSCSTKDKTIIKDDNCESSEKVQHGSCASSQNKKEIKADSTIENSSTVCLSKDVVPKTSESKNVEVKVDSDIVAPKKDEHFKEKENSGIVAPKKDRSKDKFESPSGHSSNVVDTSKDINVSSVTEPLNLDKKGSHSLPPGNDESGEKVECGNSSNSSLTKDIKVTEVVKPLNIEKNESCSSTLKKGVTEDSKSVDIERKETCSLSPSKDERDKVDESTAGNSVNFISTEVVLVTKNCNSKNIELEHNNNDNNLNKSGNNALEVAEKKHKLPVEQVTDDTFENKRSKLTDLHSSSTREKPSRSSTDDIEIIEVLNHSVTFTNRENGKKSLNFDQANVTITEKCSYRSNGRTEKLKTESDQKKLSNFTSVNNVLGIKNSSTISAGFDSSSINVAGIKNGATNVNLINSPTNVNIAGAKNSATNVVGVKNLASNAKAVNNSASSVAGVKRGSTAGSWAQKSLINNNNFTNISSNTSSPIITSAYSLAKPTGNSNFNNSTILPSCQNPHQTKDASGSGAMAKYKIPSAVNSHSHQMSLKRKADSPISNSNRLKSNAINVTRQSSFSSSSKHKDVIVIDECEDDSEDICILSEVRSSNKSRMPEKQKVSVSPCQRAASKLLAGNEIKYISEEKTKKMLKEGNIKVFSRFKPKQPSNKLKTDSVITLD